MQNKLPTAPRKKPGPPPSPEPHGVLYMRMEHKYLEIVRKKVLIMLAELRGKK